MLLLLLLAELLLHVLLHITHLAAHLFGAAVYGDDEVKYQLVQYPAY